MEMRLKNRRGQGTTEYIVVLAIVVGLALAIFYRPLKDALSGKVNQVASDINNAGR